MRIHVLQQCGLGRRPARLTCPPTRTRSVSSFSRLLSEEPPGVKIYKSRSDDPYLNLSIEHALLQNSNPGSTVLFFYTNRPCIVIGRNQNPWVEVDLKAIYGSRSQSDGPQNVDLVRRRSGGGTVFHDSGNVNWSVICPSQDFTRDKHAEMVTRALRDLGVSRARVNERHDIVLDQGSRSRESPEDDLHKSSFQVQSSGGPKPLKISGSAYKITRAKSLHHATCLLNSQNLGRIHQFLCSPAKPYIEARGVESVSSPVGNVGVNPRDFIDAVTKRFLQMYTSQKGAGVTEVDTSLLEDEMVRKGYDELQSQNWTFSQTPQFNVSNMVVDNQKTRLDLTVRHGKINGAILRYNANENAGKEILDLSKYLEEQVNSLDLFTEVHWPSVIREVMLEHPKADIQAVIDWLDEMLPTRQTFDGVNR